jgi:hypothetical protein
MIAKKDEVLVAPHDGLVYGADFVPGRPQQTTPKRFERLVQVTRIKVRTNTQCEVRSERHQPVDDPRIVRELYAACEIAGEERAIRGVLVISISQAEFPQMFTRSMMPLIPRACGYFSSIVVLMIPLSINSV